MKKVLVSCAGGVALLGAVTVAGVATPAYAASAPAPAPAAQVHGAAAHPLAHWLRMHRREVRRAVVTVSAKTIDITPHELVTDLRSGTSIAGVAGEHDVSAQTVVSALVGAADAKVNQAVTDHRLTSSQGQTIEAKIPGSVAKLVNHEFGKHTGTTTAG